MTQQLNQNETKVLSAAVGSSIGNGHDFGFTEDIVDALSGEFSEQAIGGYIADLVTKGHIQVEPKDPAFDFRQFDLRCDTCGDAFNRCDRGEDSKAYASRPAQPSKNEVHEFTTAGHAIDFDTDSVS